MNFLGIFSYKKIREITRFAAGGQEIKTVAPKYCYFAVKLTVSLLNYRYHLSGAFPLIGLKGLISLVDFKFFTSGSLVPGRFGAGSDFMWDANINLGYRWTQGFSSIIGYRYLDIDYGDGGFFYDVALDNLTLGLPRRF